MMNYLIFIDFFGIFLSFLEFILDTFGFFKLKEKFILCANMAANVGDNVVTRYLSC